MGIAVLGRSENALNFDYNSLRNGVSTDARDRGEWREAIGTGRPYLIEPTGGPAAGAIASGGGAGQADRQAAGMGRAGTCGRREIRDCAVRRWRLGKSIVQSKVAIL